MPASIGGAGIGTGVALHFSGGSGAMSTVLGIAVAFEGLLRIGRLILRTRLGRQGLLRRNLITLFFTVNNPREKFSHWRRPGHRLQRPRFASADTAGVRNTTATRATACARAQEKTLEISSLRRCVPFLRHLAHAPGLRIAAACRATTTGPQRGRKSFHIRTRRRGVETRICAKLRASEDTLPKRLMPRRGCAANRAS